MQKACVFCVQRHLIDKQEAHSFLVISGGGDKSSMQKIGRIFIILFK